MFVGVISTLMVPFTVLMVPQFILWRNLNWLTPSPIDHTLLVWFCMEHISLAAVFLTIPREFDESARLDGATHWAIFTRLILPLSKPALARSGYWRLSISGMTF